jgi:hypothetical protein
MNWHLSHRCEHQTQLIADRHYNRQSVGAPNFVPPGRCLVLRTSIADAFWVTSWPFAEYVRHAWPGAWINSAFRREPGAPLASDLIREAIAVTRWYWPDIPALGMVTFIDRSKVKHKRDFGRCYRRAGFRIIGETKGGLLALGLSPDEMPGPMEPIGSQMLLVTAC